jgi:hypothetical protein
MSGAFTAYNIACMYLPYRYSVIMTDKYSTLCGKLRKQTMHPADNPLVSHPKKQGPLRSLWVLVRKTSEPLVESARALLPIVLVIAFFQLVVLQQPIPNLGKMLWGMCLVLAGLALFGRADMVAAATRAHPVGPSAYGAMLDERFPIPAVDLTQIDPHDAILFVPTAEEAQQLQQVSPWRVIVLERD